MRADEVFPPVTRNVCHAGKKPGASVVEGHGVVGIDVEGPRSVHLREGETIRAMVTVAPAAADDEPSPEWLEACRRGDPEAFARLFEHYKDRVYSIALRFSGDPVEAADVTQDVFLKLLTRIGQFRGQSRFGTWIYRVVVNTCLDRSKTRPRELPLAEPFGSSGSQPPHQEEEATRAEAARQLARALALLDAAFRTPLLLRYVAGLSYAEIAEVLGLPPGTVASRISRGLLRLAKDLSHLKRI
jgi:RNA polymerase sigma-70 factor (ECF subfamily)